MPEEPGGGSEAMFPGACDGEEPAWADGERAVSLVHGRAEREAVVTMGEAISGRTKGVTLGAEPDTRVKTRNVMAAIG